MTIWYKRSASTMIVAVLLYTGSARAQQPNSDTFTITISLQQSTIHAGGKTSIVTTFANPTDHVITLGEGSNGGMARDIVTDRGENIWPQVLQNAHPQIPRGDTPLFSIVRASSLKKSKKVTFAWSFTGDPKFMPSGKYKLRVHRRDLDKNIEVYSNEVTLTIVP